MPLELIVEKIDALPETIRGLYVEKEGKYHLDVTGIEDVSGLKKSHEKLLAEKKQASENEKKAKADAEAARLEAAKTSGDIATLNKSWEEKFNSTISEKDAALSQSQQLIHNLTVGATAESLANKIAIQGCAEAFLLPIRSRLTVDLSTGSPVVQVLDKNGKPSALTLADLENEFRKNPAYAKLVAASGGSGAGYRPGGGSAPATTITRDEFMKLSPKDQGTTLKKGITVID